MTLPDPVLSKALRRSLNGIEAHVKTRNAVDGLTAEVAGRKPLGVPHSIFQILNHLVYWQDKILEWLDGRELGWPEHAEVGWPGGEHPESQDEWDDLAKRFSEGVNRAIEQIEREDLLEVRGKWAPVELIRSLASHNSYHLGQIVQLRRMLGSWPPPGGGDTW